MVFEDKMFQ